MTAMKDVRIVYLKAGEMHYADRPALVVTVLGSCLAVTMYSPRLNIGAICHGLLPQCAGRRACMSACREEYKYVDCAIQRMIGLFEKAGAKRDEIEVKCFGGADMFMRPIEKPGVVSVGRQNIMTAEHVLKREGLTITKQDVGGMRGRKLFFYTDTGEVLLKRLNNGDDPELR